MTHTFANKTLCSITGITVAVTPDNPNFIVDVVSFEDGTASVMVVHERLLKAGVTMADVLETMGDTALPLRIEGEDISSPAVFPHALEAEFNQFMKFIPVGKAWRVECDARVYEPKGSDVLWMLDSSTVLSIVLSAVRSVNEFSESPAGQAAEAMMEVFKCFEKAVKAEAEKP